MFKENGIFTKNTIVSILRIRVFSKYRKLHREIEMGDILKRRIEYLTGGSAPKEILEKLEEECREILEEYKENNTLIENSEQKILVERIRDSYKKILTLGVAYNTENSLYNKDEQLVVVAMEVLENNYRNYYNLESVEHTNWWQWEIGYPLLINDILILFYEEFKKSFTDKIVDVTKYFLPDERYLGNNPVAIHPTGSPLRVATGGNLIDTCKIIFLRGAILKDLKICQKAVESISETLNIVSEKNIETISNRDGFYKDGSFIQHGFIPYAGTYGNVLLSGIAEIIYLVDKKLRDKIDIEKICERVYLAFEPLFFRGAMTDIVNGRAITREGNDHQIGHEIINSLLLLADGVDEKNRVKLLEIAKRELVLDEYYLHREKERKAIFYNLSTEVLKNLKIKVKNYPSEVKCFNEMNRVFYRNMNFAIGVAMHSNKIGNFETFNGENTKGWFTGDGGVYIYSKGDEYIDYWKDVDFYYIPGTTEIKMDMENRDGIESSIGNMPKNSVAEAYGDVDSGVAYMDFINWNGKLKSRKNYIFKKTGMFYLESCISGEGEVYSTVVNMRISNLKDKEVYIDGKIMVGFSIAGRFKEINLGNLIYKFYKSEKINLEIYGEKENRFVKIWIDLGRNPINYTIAWEVVVVV